MGKVKRKSSSLSEQIKKKAKKPVSVANNEYEGDETKVVSTGSTLLDLAISGGRVRGGGILSGILVVAYGPSGGGKTALACEIAGSIARAGGQVEYRDAEGRVDKAYAKNFGLDIDNIGYERTRTIKTTFDPLIKWEPNPDNINGWIVDSLASLSTEMELESEDKMGMRRAKEFSTTFRQITVPIPEKNAIVFCTNQIRENADAGMYQRKDVNPGGKAIEFYASLILRFSGIKLIKKEFKFGKKKKMEVIGMEATIEVDKSSIWKPHRKAPIIIYFDYGIDDIRANLQYVKDYTGAGSYAVKDIGLGIGLDKAVETVEEKGLEKKLRKQVISIWEEYESQITVKRKEKQR